MGPGKEVRVNPEDVVAAALAHVSPEDRETWIRMGMALRASGLPGAMAIWLQWSSHGSSFRHREAVAAWRSFRPGGPITMGTFWHTVRQHGWAGTGIPRPRLELPRRQRKAAKREAIRRRTAARRAAERAQRVVRQAQLDRHPYLEAKGHPMAMWLRQGDDLIVPMRDAGGLVLGYQKITPDGSKRFLPSGCRIAGTTYTIGRGSLFWLVEGLATALSIRSALRRIGRGRRDRVMICFSAANLVRVGSAMDNPAVVIADHDESGTGQQAAMATGLTWWMPNREGWDANDVHVERGIHVLSRELQRLVDAAYHRRIHSHA